MFISFGIGLAIIHPAIRDSEVTEGLLQRTPGGLRDYTVILGPSQILEGLAHAKTALKNDTTLKYETLKSGLIKEKDYDKIVNPKKMIYPS